MDTKKFTACIYLYHGHAVTNFTDMTIVDTDPVRLSKFYSERNIDEMVIFDLSDDDVTHEEALDIIKEICASVEVDVYGMSRIRRMEDVKKILYTGCKKAILDIDNPDTIQVLEEVSLKFGKDKMVVSSDNLNSLSDNKDLIENYASLILLKNPHIIRETTEALKLPISVHINQLALNKLLEIFANENVVGVTGNTINQNVNEILSLKDLCKENGMPVEGLSAKYTWNDFSKDSNGLVPVVVQDYKTMEVLMVAYMNEEAYLQTIRCGKMTYYSRSRQELWLKGETSGHYQYVKSLTADCDMDTILAVVSQVGVACHTGSKSCFFNNIAKIDYIKNTNPLKVFENVSAVIKDRKINPKEGSYTNYLFDKGIDKILKKVGEEATEIVIAAKNPNPNEIKYEIADFLYHMMVLMEEKEVSWEEITEELAKR